MTTPTTVNVRLQLRADTAANWTAANPTLLANEVGLETDTKKLKVGNGSSAWNSLAYFPSIVSGGTVLGNLEIGSTGTLTFEGSTADGFETTLAVTNPTADRTITLPNQSGTVVVSGNASIVDADIAANAEIAVSKLADGAARQLLQTDAAGTGVEWTSNVDIPGTLDVTGAATFDGAVTVAGDLTVNGTTTNINTQNLVVEDKNIILGDVATPSDVTADGGGITLKGATDKTINWVDSTDAWTSSERFSVPLGSAASPSLTFTGDENSGVYSPGADQVAISTNSVGRLFVDSTGRVGIGASPALSDGGASLQLYTNGANTSASVGNAALTLQSVNRNANLNIGSASTGISSIFFHDQSGLGTGNAPARIACTISEKNLVFETGGVPGSSLPQERLRITSAGLVGVGTSSPINSVDVNGGVGVHYTYGIRAYRDQETVNNLILGHTYTNSNDQLNLAPVGQSPTSAIAFKTATGSTLGTRMFIGPTGNVGIGTTSPSVALDIANADACEVRVRATTNSVDTRLLSLGLGANCGIVGTYSNHPLVFNTNSSERVRLTASGQLLVGTSSQLTSAGSLKQEIANGNLHISSFAANAFANSYGFTKSRSASSIGTIVQSGDELGNIDWLGDDGTSTAKQAARIQAFVDGTPGANDMPGRIVLSTTLDGASSPTEALRITNDAVVAYNQAAPAAVNTTATLTVANLKTGIITSTTAAAVTMTLPTGTLTEGGFSGAYNNMTFEWSVINTGGTNAVTVQAGTDHTLVGSGTVSANNSGRFATRRTALNTWVTYRLSS